MNSPKIHPVKISYVGVKQITLETLIPPDPSLIIELSGKMIPKSRTMPGEYNEQKHEFMVFSECEIGQKKDREGTPLYLDIILGVRFTVIDPAKFTPDDVAGFAKNYSRYLIQPFMREHVFALSARAGFQPIILPALLLPVFRRADMIEKPVYGNEEKNKV